MINSSTAMSTTRKAFTLIELLVVIAIIGLLATVSVLSLQNARAKSRDAKRVADMKQLSTALELFFNDNNRYPTIAEWNTGQLYSTTTGVTSTYMKIIPNAPTPADGGCESSQNIVNYIPSSDGSSYTISFCLGGNTGTLASGPKCLTPGGIINDDCFQRFFVNVGGSGSQSARSVAQTADGGYIVAGDTDANGGDMYIAKLNPDGSLYTSFDGDGMKNVGSSGLEKANSIAQTADGGYIVAGSTNSTSDVYLVKLNPDGSLDTSFDTDGIINTNYRGVQIANSVAQTADGGYIVAGYTDSNSGDMYLVKLNADGSLDTSFDTDGIKNIDGGASEVANFVAQTADGGYIVAGTTSWMGSDMYVVKLNADGSPDTNPGSFYDKLLGTNYYEVANSVAQTADGGYIVAGGSSGPSYSDMYVVKLTANGTVAWEKNVGGSGSQQANSIDQTADGGYIVAGYTDSNSGDMYIAKLTADGSYDTYFNSEGFLVIGDSLEQRAYSVAQTTDSGYVVVGGASSGGVDMDIIKMDSRGRYQ